MDPGRNYASPFEDQLRHMILNHNTPQHNPPPVPYQAPPRPPPGFASSSPVATRAQYSNNIPMDRQQGFSQFLQQHHVTAPAPMSPQRLPPHRPSNHTSGNNFRHQSHQASYRNQNPRSMDPNDFHRPRQESRPYAPQNQNRQLYQPQSQPRPSNYGSNFERQTQFLDWVATQEISKVQMSDSEVELKDGFRVKLQRIFENLKSPDPENPLPSVELASFGSLSSGFATAGSDMDLAIVTSTENDLSQRFSSHENGLPRVLEKELLDNGIGARLLTRTRVPIIKICEEPTVELLGALREARDKWDNLPDDEKYATTKPSDDTAPKKDATDAQHATDQAQPQIDGSDKPTSSLNSDEVSQNAESVSSLVESTQDMQISADAPTEPGQPTSHSENTQQPNQPSHDKQANRQRNDRNWRREKAAGPLDFPKQGVGIQCDINFFNPLGIHNTKMLRCYSKCDPRVRPMVLFIKSWAKRRKINSSYSGTLSSYGYVLMVLHYLVNVANPPVLPNLQHEAEANNLPPTTVDGYEVRFFDREDLIESRASQGSITQNNEPLGKLLVGFFKYYAVNSGGFFWTRDVLSLRTGGGTLTKEEKGWTGAKTEVGENKEVRHRYLFAIEDPFETTHNVARTVTHNGICAIRDEFRRAWRILLAVGRRDEPEGGLFDELVESEEQPAATTAPPPAANKVQAYSQQFPTLGGQSGTAAASSVSKPAAPAQAPAQSIQAAPLPPQVPAPQPTPSQATQPEPSTAPTRGKGRRQKFVPLDL